MKNFFIGLIATGFMTLSSFTTAPAKTAATNADDYGCCTAHNRDWSRTVTVCDNSGNCKNAVKAYNAIY